MKSKSHGQSTSEVEVSHIDAHGFWLCVSNKEYFLPYENYPWFKDARIREVLNVQLLHKHHISWPELDVDLEVDSLENPQQYPLIFK